MKFEITNDVLVCNKKSVVRAKSVNWYDLEFTFDTTWNNLSKKIVYVSENGDVIENAILDNKSTVPSVVNGVYSIGVIGFISQNNTIIKRVSTNLLKVNITSSGAEYNGTAPSDETISTYEKYLQDITAKAVQINNYLTQIESDKAIIEEDKEEMTQIKNDTQGYSELALDYVASVTFSTFEVDLTTGKLYIVNSEKLKNANFSINQITGKLEVIVNG